MRIKPSIFLISIISALTAALSSCSSSTSYAELLNDENKSVNRFLVNQIVIPSIPADSVFETGPDAPYYQLDEEGNVYMQVLSVGDGKKVTDDQIVYFRFTRWDLSYYTTTLDNIASSGNMDDMTQTPTSFRYQNFTLPSSAYYGSGIQMPLAFLPLNSEVNLIVKSQYGFTNEISYVRPFLYRIRYYKSMI
ncbi:MAG: DUF4827 domain-containing protein [Paramuribaculum sp.]|nr:DUF4827 domain-containing protein [Paramuribaculum sp.]MDE6323391.1 DUF4827 domain-containing protein [Paramuribaculum sp.]